MDKHEAEIMREIENAESMIDHDYLQQLTKFDVSRRSSAAPDFEKIRLFRLSRLIYSSGENVAQKLACVLGALQICSGNTFLFLKGMKDSIEIFIGIRAFQATDVRLLGSLLHDGMLGNFAGSYLEEISGDAKVQELERLTYYDEGDRINITSVNIIPSKKKDMSAQGLEKLVDTMLGQEYSCLIIASPVPSEELKARIRGFQNLYSCISPFAKTSMSMGENKGVTVTEGTARSVSDSISKSVSTATGRFSSHSEGTSSNIGVGGPMLLGLSIASGTSRADTFGTSQSESKTTGSSSSTGVTHSEAQSSSSGTSQSITVEYVNKTAQRVLEKIDLHCSRLRESASYGLWESAVFFLSPQIQTSVIAASAFRAQLTGEESFVENACINLFTRRNRRQLQAIQEYLLSCEIPSFNIHGSFSQSGLAVSATNYVSSKELAELFALPIKPLPGIAVASIAEFGRTVNSSAAENRRTLRLGKTHHMGMDQGTEVELDLDSLASHCFITGTTGSGKSNAVYHLIDSFIEQKIPFLVIEPAKGEYKQQYSRYPDIRIFTTNPYMCEFLKINPFRFDPRIHILEHLDRLIEIFNTCWEMYAAMPAILKDAIEAIYIQKGWDLLNSAYLGKGAPEYPSFTDLLRILPEAIAKSNYSSDTKSDYTGALVTRVRSLTNGIYGQIFTCGCDISDAELFDCSTIIDLSRIGSSETRSLIMGIIVLRLTEYRQAHAEQMNADLRHVTVLEEAHNLLKNFRAGNSIANNVAMKSVEMISNSIAEMRTYGEGFIIVDQSPTSVDESAIKNTNTKIIMRLPDKADCVLVGHALSLKDEQIAELPRLNKGIAVVMQNDWLESVLVHIPRAADKYQGMPETIDLASLKAFRSHIISLLLDEYALSDRRDIERIDCAVETYEISKYKKFEIRRVLNELHQSIPSATATWLLYCAGMSNRFADCRIEAFEEVLDNERNTQFAAVSFRYGDERIVAYRGTDTSIAGWKEDCQLSYSDAVPSQLLALEFMNKQCDDLQTVICGHSKGGNLAVYTLLHLSEDKRESINIVYNFDGPGFCFELLNMESYTQLKDKIITIVPESSIIGMLLEHEEDYFVIESNMPSILQHDALFWKIKGPSFVYLNDRSMTSMVIDQALQEWIKGISLAERRQFIDLVFGIIENAGISDITDLTENSIGKAAKLLSGMTSLSSQQRKMVIRLLLNLLKASNSALYDTLAGRGILKELVDGLTVGSNYIADIIDKGKSRLLTTFTQGFGRKESGTSLIGKDSRRNK